MLGLVLPYLLPPLDGIFRHLLDAMINLGQR